MTTSFRWPGEADCLFCSVTKEPIEGLPWYDRPIFRASGVGVAIPAVGAFVPGYVLVTPLDHVSSLQGLPRRHAPPFLAFIADVLARVEERFGACTLFEHGSCRAAERRRSACITHAHVHILPGCYSFHHLKLPVVSFERLDDLLEMRSEDRSDGYLMYREPAGPVCYSRDLGISQFFRRHIADVLGMPDDWDYALFPHWTNIRNTVDVLADQATTASLSPAGDH